MTFYFYDLETSSASPKTGRIMQFAGQRTNESLEPIGAPDNILIRLADDVVPEPDAILVHGITPQKTLDEGINEAEFAEFFHSKIALESTVFVGYNNIRFDDEFMRRVCYRTFYDPYQWHWKDQRSRWDLLDPIRMMRALRPDGLRWPTLNGKPTVKLELLAKENGITHENAHDAQSDVLALIDIARMFRNSQPKLFDFLLSIRDKRSVARIVETGKPFVYTSGRYNSLYEKTTVVKNILHHPKRDGSLVYDLREDPTKWTGLSVEELIKHWQPAYGSDIERLPIKLLMHNKAPAVAPLSVLDTDTQKRLALDMPTIRKHEEILEKNQEFLGNIAKVLDSIEKTQQVRLEIPDSATTVVTDGIYDGFWGSADQAALLKVRMTDPDELMSIMPDIANKRIREMIPLYKARNYRSLLKPDELEFWEKYRSSVLFGGGSNSPLARAMTRMQEISHTHQRNEREKYLLSELQLYIESIVPDQEIGEN